MVTLKRPLTVALPTAITVLSGSPMASLSVQAHGSTARSTSMATSTIATGRIMATTGNIRIMATDLARGGTVPPSTSTEMSGAMDMATLTKKDTANTYRSDTVEARTE